MKGYGWMKLFVQEGQNGWDIGDRICKKMSYVSGSSSWFKAGHGGGTWEQQLTVPSKGIG